MTNKITIHFYRINYKNSRAAIKNNCIFNQLHLEMTLTLSYSYSLNGNGIINHLIVWMVVYEKNIILLYINFIPFYCICR